MMQRLTLLVLMTLLLATLRAHARHQVVTSPDGGLVVNIDLKDGIPYYQVIYHGHTMLNDSPLGFVADAGDFAHGLAFVKARRDTVIHSYTLHWSKAGEVTFTAHRLVCTLANAQGNEMSVEFLVANHDIAFRYCLPPSWNQGETTCAVIRAETTGFSLPAGTTSFLTPQAPPMSTWKRTHPAYEEEYAADQPLAVASKYGHGYTFPCLFRVGDAGWVLISETGVRSNYCASHLSECSPDGCYTIAFPHPGENNGIGTSSPGIGLPEVTPWRTITVGSTLAPIVETTIPFDVVEPLYEPSIDYRPGRATWSWIMWQDTGTNYDDQIRYIDLAHALGWEYVLVDAGWDVTIGRERVEQLAAYARARGVSLFLWYNSSRAANDTDLTPTGMDNSVDRKREMRWLRQAGIAGIKVDFFGGDKQETMRLYEDILTEANDHGLMVIFHGATLPRGWERMYPNFVSSEAVLASENLYFQEHYCRQEAFNACLHPFVRNTVGAMDFGGTILNTRMSRDNASRHRRVTGDAFQLATAVLFQAAVQNFALTPDNLTTAPPFALDFMRHVPTTWDETRLIDGYPGRYVVLARRHGTRWYVAGVNAGSAPRRLTFQLPSADSYSMIVDRQGMAEQRAVRPNRHNQVTVEVPPDGGFVIYSPACPPNPQSPQAPSPPNPQSPQAPSPPNPLKGECLVLQQPCTPPFRGAWGDLTFNPERCKGQDSVDAAGVFVTHRLPPQYHSIENCHLFNVAVNGADVALYDDHNVWGGRLNFGSFEFEDGHEVEITISSREPIQSYELLPRSVQYQLVHAGEHGLTLRMSRADQKLTLIINGDPKTHPVLHLFCNSIDHDNPRPDITSGYVYDEKLMLHYFGPGYHDADAMFGGKLNITGDERVYLAAGAVVRGCLGIERGHGAKIYGRGMVFSDTQTRGGMMLTVSHSDSCIVEGLTFHRHAKDCWQTGTNNSRHITFNNLNIISAHYASTDGIDVCNSQDCTFENCFVRASDDAIAIKGLDKGVPAHCAPCRNLVFRHMQLWNDCNNAFGMGAETRAAAYEHIRFVDSDILFSYDDPDFHGQLHERAAINICCLHGTYFSDIVCENINIYHCQRFVGLTFQPSFWFGAIAGDQSTAGGISHVTFSNIQCHSDPGSPIAGEVRMMGWHQPGTPDKLVEDITFDHVHVDGEPLQSLDNRHIVTNNHPRHTLVRNIIFK